MQIVTEPSLPILRPSVATIGFFDGVHCGHRHLIAQVRDAAAVRGLASSVITFPVHPRKVMQTDFHPALLTVCDEKTALLAWTGVDYCMMLDFTPEMARLSARQFMTVLRDRYKVRVLVIGYDHRFGHNRSEDFSDYLRYGSELGMEVVPSSAYASEAGTTVSSSMIRRLLQQGRVTDAAIGLGYDYFLEGTVVAGHQVGRTIGFPTANLRVCASDKLVPANGVYAVRVSLDGKQYGGMLCIGLRPTLENGTDRSIEVHIFHFNADIYQHRLLVSFVRYMRPEEKFDSLDKLVSRLHRDEEEVKAVLSL